MRRLVGSTVAVTVFLLALGALDHGVIVMRVPVDDPGTRLAGSDGRADEFSSLGEASRSCGSGAGNGFKPDTRRWVTVSVRPGSHELLCDIPWHYAKRMFATIAVRWENPNEHVREST
ncbi:MAG TPA: hypothetical protein VII96_08575 [Acidimicrobiales bacterium]